MMGALTAAAVADLFSQVTSIAQKLGGFETITGHEPKAAPVSTPALALWWNGIGPARGASGLASTSTRCEFRGRLYLDGMSKPEDATEQKLLTLSALLLGAYSAGFTLGGDAIAVDLLGAWGTALEAQGGWLEQDGHHYRIADITIPAIIDATWSQSP